MATRHISASVQSMTSAATPTARAANHDTSTALRSGRARSMISRSRNGDATWAGAYVPDSVTSAATCHR
jgi:hypothetical protein